MPSVIRSFGERLSQRVCPALAVRAEATFRSRVGSGKAKRFTASRRNDQCEISHEPTRSSANHTQTLIVTLAMCGVDRFDSPFRKTNHGRAVLLLRGIDVWNYPGNPDRTAVIHRETINSTVSHTSGRGAYRHHGRALSAKSLPLTLASTLNPSS
ncbi:MAG: hypothetical protein JWP89_4381 [Schlesneria sp.]|nr:hypothetical protein [Schlesneria sp.]